MTTLIFGGVGFVGLNIAERLLSDGKDVVLFDQSALPVNAANVFAELPGCLKVVSGDVRDNAAIAAVVAQGIDTVVLGSAITADATREARDPETILQVNLMPLPSILRACKLASVRRILNLSSSAAYGRSAMDLACVNENSPTQPTGLYGITKLSSEMIGERLADLWEMDFVSLRLSAVFGPWERATGVRDTTSAPFQITEAARLSKSALLARPGMRDWVYAADVADAVALVLKAPSLQHRIYNVSSPERWSALNWGEHLALLRPGFECRLVFDSEVPTIDLHTPVDRGSLSVYRLAKELGWSAQFGMTASVEHLDSWRRGFLSSTKESS
jgi:UDP-glucose 4-epimerase